ncbi:hypothetical protein ABMA57_13145 [Saccharospirillum sp. HFRX-1]|uniref:hypothetical protein n=1 Tax=unclassified Saccharospirillum TaxID=2633430 RepID=UPI00371E362E
MMSLWQRRTLAVLTLGGACIGIVSVLQVLISNRNPVIWAALLLYCLYYCWGVWLGIKLLERNPNAPARLRLFWLFQVPFLSSPFLGYFISTGFYLTTTVGWEPIRWLVNFQLGSIFSFSINDSSQSYLIGCNIFALAVVIWLAKKLNNSVDSDDLTQPDADNENKAE